MSNKRQKIKQAIRNDSLEVDAVDPETGDVERKQVTDVLRHDASDKDIVRVSLENGDDVIVTEDHSLFCLSHDRDRVIQPVEASKLRAHESIIYVEGHTARPVQIASVTRTLARKYMYDLSVEDHQNFVLDNGILAHNSYSIGGVSLDINKADSYESLQQTANDQFEKLLEQKTKTVNITKGLRQSDGIGLRAATGPVTGHGILTPRKYLGF